MCGILGFVRSSQSSVDQGLFKHALNTLEHRGPDDQGIWTDGVATLGHRRLSIIDTSHAGHQPMLSASGASTIVFNGEIYNYLELRAELTSKGHNVSGGSDTGVLLEMVEAFGQEALPRLNGMWAFAIWNSAQKKLLLSRDRFGVKPLYYTKGPEGLAFASEPKALLELIPSLRRVNRSTLLDFLANNSLCNGEQSFYEGIYQFPAGHLGVYDASSGELSLLRYWNYPVSESESIESNASVDEFEELFNDAIRLRLRSDVPVGITLSGGLDSTAVLAAAGKNGNGRLRCFTSTYDQGSAGEYEWAQRAASVTGADLLAVPAARNDWVTVMSEVSWHMDGPGYSPAVYPLWCLMKKAREEGVPVLLEGQGADEALAGYPNYSALDFILSLRKDGLISAKGRLQGMAAAFSLKWSLAWILRESFPGLLNWHRSRSGFQALLRKGIQVPVAQVPALVDKDPVRSRLLQDHSFNILPGLLHYGDAISMAHSIESRCPFMDYRLVEWMFKLPTKYKIRNGQTKWVLREYLRRNGQTTIANRRDKKGYPTPVAQWLSSDIGYELERKLVEMPNILHEWIEPSRIKDLFEGVRRGHIAKDHHLYKLISTQMWLDRCIDGRTA